MRGHGDYVVLGRTRDGRFREAFEKQPGYWDWAPRWSKPIEQPARNGIASLKLPRAWLKGTKRLPALAGSRQPSCAWRRRVRWHYQLARVVSFLPGPDARASFQQAVVDVLVTKRWH